MRSSFAAFLFGAGTALLLAASGCMKSDSLSPEQFGQLYQVSPDRWADATPALLAFNDKTIPNKVVVAYESNLMASARSLAAVRGQLAAGTSSARLLIADELADSAAGVLREAAARTETWAEAAEDYARPSGRDRWVRDTAAVLILLYRIDRGPGAIDPREAIRHDRSAGAMLAPALRSMALYMMKRMEVETGGGEILGALGDQRQLPAEFMLRAAFRTAALEMPARVPAEVMEIFDRGPPTALGVEHELRGRLAAWRAQAEKLPRSGVNKQAARYLRTVPLLLRTMARFFEQWDKFYLVSAELGQVDGNEVVSLVLDVQPGQSVRLDAVHPMAPVLTMEGRTRLNFWTADSPEAEVVHMQFVDERAGRVAVRFESWVYGLASLLTFPIEDWALREIIVTTTEPERHRKVTTVKLLLETCRYRGPADDPRRVMQIRTDRRLQVTTRGDVVDRIVRYNTLFEFCRAQRVWRYERSSRQLLPQP